MTDSSARLEADRFFFARNLSNVYFTGNPKLQSWQTGNRLELDTTWVSSHRDNWLCSKSPRTLESQLAPRHSLRVLGWPVSRRSSYYLHKIRCVWGRACSRPTSACFFRCVCIYKLHIYICGIYCFEHHHFYSWVHVFCYHWITVVLLLTDHLGVWGRAFGCINLLQISMYLPPLLDRSPGALYR